MLIRLSIAEGEIPSSFTTTSAPRVAWVVGPRSVIDAVVSAGSFLDGGGSRPLQRAAIPLLEPGYADLEADAIQGAFRRKHPGPSAFRMWGYPYTSVLGAGLMLAILTTSVFTREFRMTLIYGLPFLAVLTIAYHVWFRVRQ